MTGSSPLDNREMHAARAALREVQRISLKFAPYAVLAFVLGATALLLGCRGLSAQAVEIPAFPGAEGWGAQAVGGRGGKVIEVTNLNDAGTGSLRDCIEDTGPRVCVFRTGGTIELQKRLTIANPFITIAGQTAPGGGIVLTNKLPGGDTPLVIKTHDVIVRYIRSRPGPGSQLSGDLDAIAIEGGAKDVIIDHSSFSWSVDENVQIAQSEDVTIQWSITSEALLNSLHETGDPHSMGLIVLTSDRTSILHNLFAHNDWRNPRLKSTADVINNVIYNTGGFPDNWGGGATAPISVNAIGNIWIDGPSTVPGRPYAFRFQGTGIYVEGNILPERLTRDLPEEFAIDESQRHLIASTKFESPDVTVISAFETHDQVLADAGASARLDCQGNFVSNYDATDQRIIDDVINGTGQVIDHPDEVGGWVSLSSGTPCVDEDHDGMADEWENIYFGSLAQGSSSDSSSDFDGDGYTDLEEFLNGTVPTEGEVTPEPTASPTPEPSPTPTASPTPAPSPTPTASPTPGPSPTPTLSPTSKPTPIPGEVQILIEAEDGALSGAMTVETDTNASGGSYITAPTRAKAQARHQVEIPSTGTYYIWARLYRSDPIAVRLDIGIDRFRDELSTSFTGAYEWVRMETSEGSGVFGLDLRKGRHEIRLGLGQTGLRIDALYVTDDPQFTPGEIAPVPTASPTSIPATPVVEPTATATSVPATTTPVPATATATPTVTAPVPTARVPATPVPTVVAPPSPEAEAGIPGWVWLIIGLLAGLLAGAVALIYFTRWRQG